MGRRMGKGDDTPTLASMSARSVVCSAARQRHGYQPTLRVLRKKNLEQ